MTDQDQAICDDSSKQLHKIADEMRDGVYASIAVALVGADGNVSSICSGLSSDSTDVPPAVLALALLLLSRKVANIVFPPELDS